MSRVALLLLLLAPAASPEGTAVLIDLSHLRVPPPPEDFPALCVPSDPGFPGFSDDEVAESWLDFDTQAAPYDAFAISPEIVAAFVQRLVQLVEVGATGSALLVKAPPEKLARVQEAVAYLAEAMARPLPVSAALHAVDGAAGRRLLAAGAADLAPRRWTRLFLHRSHRRFPVGYNIEIAQESVAAAPILSPLHEGAELYVRFTPGETVSLLEVVAGCVDHLHPFAVDLAGVRNVPESNALGRIELPRTAVRRAYAVLVVPGGKATTHTLAWDGPGGPRLLELRAGPLPASPPDREVADGLRAGILRAGALLSPLSEGQREGALDEFLRRWAWSEEAPPHESLAHCFLVAEGVKEKVELFRALVAFEEQRLRQAVVELRAVAVPEAPLREALAAGRATVGGALAPAEVAALVEAAGAPVCSLKVPALLGVWATARAGASVAMLTQFDVEVAQQSGGMQPNSWAKFEGLAADVRVTEGRDGGCRLELEGTLAWARPDAAAVELAFRPPVGMAFNREGVKSEVTEVRRVPIPVGAGGEAALRVAAGLSRKDLEEGRPMLLGVASAAGRAGFPDTVIVLATISLQ